MIQETTKMNQSRRRFFGLFPALAAATAIPNIAAVETKQADDAVGPIMFEHICDNGSSRYTTEELEEFKRTYPERYSGCGTRFRWYFGTMAICPNCGIAYSVSLDDAKKGFYKRVSG